MNLSLSYLLLLFFMGSCCPITPWSFRKVVSDSPKYNSAILFHRPSNQFSGIELQFLKGQFGLLGYLNVYSRRISSPQLNLNNAIVVIQIEGQRYRYQAFRMEGGQRLLLPEEATDQLIEALLACHCITIYLEGFSTEISSKSFPTLYQQFASVPTNNS